MVEPYETPGQMLDAALADIYATQEGIEGAIADLEAAVARLVKASELEPD